MAGIIDEILSGRAFNRLANFSFGRKTPIGSSNSSKSFKKSTSQDSGPGSHTIPQEEYVTRSQRNIVLGGEHTTVASRSQEALRAQENTAYHTFAPIQHDPDNAELEAIHDKSNLELDTKDGISLDQYRASSSNEVKNQVPSPTTVRGQISPVSAPTVEEDMVRESEPFGLKLMDERDSIDTIVPQDIIKSWNHKFHCVRKIKNRERRLNKSHEDVFVANNMIQQIQEILAEGTQTEDLDVHLQRMAEVKEKTIKNINRLQEKLFVNQAELPKHEQSFLDNWEEFMHNNNLIYVPSSASEGSMRSDEEELEGAFSAEEVNHEASNGPDQNHEPHESYSDWDCDQYMRQSPIEQTPYDSFNPYSIEQDVQYRPIEPISHEINKRKFAGPALMEEAQEVFREKGARLAEANAKLENWGFHCEDKLAKFRDYPDIDAAQLQYDQELFIEKSQATRELIEAEKDLDEAKAYYRALGVYLQADDQESQFQDQVDDGIETDGRGRKITRVTNYGLIHRWLDLLDEQNETRVDVENMDENNCRPRQEIEKEIDECWMEVPEVETWESTSVYAVDSKRRKIDYWRSVCVGSAVSKE